MASAEGQVAKVRVMKVQLVFQAAWHAPAQVVVPFELQVSQVGEAAQLRRYLPLKALPPSFRSYTLETGRTLNGERRVAGQTRIRWAGKYARTRLPPRSEASTEGCPSVWASVPSGGRWPRAVRRTNGDAGQSRTLIPLGSGDSSRVALQHSLTIFGLEVGMLLQSALGA